MPTDHSDLIAEAKAHIDSLLDGLPLYMRTRVVNGESDDQRVSLIVRLTRALEERPPEPSDRFIAEFESWPVFTVFRIKWAHGDWSPLLVKRDQEHSSTDLADDYADYEDNKIANYADQILWWKKEHP